ncbi:MAG: hypothetical protein AAGJ84_15430 [Pseudomonadota bacterium]
MIKASEERVFELIAAYGAEPGGWPEDERDAVKATLVADPDLFAEALAEAKALDAALLAEQVPDFDPALADRILAAAPKPKSAGALASILTWRLPARRWPAGATLASLMVGLVSGYAYAGNTTLVTYDASDEVYVSLFGEDTGLTWLEEGLVE